MKKAMNENDIEAPQLLTGITLDDEEDEIQKLKQKKSEASSKAAT